MNRRGFLRRLGIGIAGFALSRQLSGILPAPPSPLLFGDGLAPTFIGLGLKVGDVLTFTGTYRFNPETRRPDASLGLQQFVITTVPDA